MRRPTINISPPERTGRILVGAIGAIGGALLLTTASAPLAIALEAILMLAGLDLILTGALGHCPLYAKLGHTPSSMRRTS
jgi:hypothetical protein